MKKLYEEIKLMESLQQREEVAEIVNEWATRVSLAHSPYVNYTNINMPGAKQFQKDMVDIDKKLHQIEKDIHAIGSKFIKIILKTEELKYEK